MAGMEGRDERELFHALGWFDYLILKVAKRKRPRYMRKDKIPAKGKCKMEDIRLY